jgi:hypothetical protein
MKTFFSVVALCSVVAAPAFAQGPSAHNRAEWSSRVHVYAPGYYARTHSFGGNLNNNLNPDFQLGGGGRQ